MTASMTSFSPNPASLLTDEHLMHARDTYRPTKVLPTTEMAFANWSDRVSAQPALVTARELSGLADENLVALATEFEQTPAMRRKLRWIAPVGISTALAGGLMLALSTLGAAQTGITALTGIGALALLGGLVAMGVASLRAFQGVPLERAYGLLGLYVGEMNEQHPWLYKTVLLTHNTAAEAYRVRVLSERGALRGVDYVMMEEIASAHQNMELTTTARTMRERVQSLPQPAQK